MTQHKSDEEALIHINLLIVKGKLTFRQLILFLVTLFLGIAFVSVVSFSSLAINNKFFNYDKNAISIKTDNVDIQAEDKKK